MNTWESSIWRAALDSPVKLVALCLARRATPTPQGREVIATYAQICADTGYGRATAHRAVAYLCDHDWLAKTAESSRYDPPVYRLTRPSAIEPVNAPANHYMTKKMERDLLGAHR